MSAHALPDYAELHALSNFSFQRGASHADELAERAAELGYKALAVTDECSVAGVVKAHEAARAHGLKLLPGAEFLVQAAGAFRLVVLPHNAAGWGNLCEFITEARRAGDAIEKGSYRVTLAETDFSRLADCEILLSPLPEALPVQALCAHAAWALRLFGAAAWLAVELQQGLDDALRLQQLQEVAAHTGIGLVAAGNVLMHKRSRKPLHDVMTAIKLGRPVHECGFALQANAEAHLRPRMRLAGIYPAALLRATLVVAARCNFSLDEIRDLYRYPRDDMVPPAETPARWLRRLSWQGAHTRYPQGIPRKVRKQLGFELALIEELEYEMFFITVHDIVRFARQEGILCQGRGSAANSVVCFCLGVTAVNPAESKLLFERFISRERREPPDIDVDFEHERREEVIQYIYGKYGHDRAAIAATIISYRPRSAIRDVGKALAMEPELIDQFAKEHFWFDGSEVLREKIRQAGLAGREEPVLQWLDLSAQLIGFPRHLSQHVGGFVLTQGKLTRLVPVQPASMEDRRIIQWDKDDLEAMGLLKVDVLALGMLSAIRRCLALVNQTRGTQLQMHQVKPDEKTYDMICAADTVGVFQIESRAQMSMLPRLQPRSYYDLVVEVAIVRPGPIQGGMVHPYLKNREAQRRGETITPEYPALNPALERTLGIPIFQEQVMQIAMIAADFTPGEADDLRRSMAAWKRKGGVERFHGRLVQAMVKNGYSTEFAERIFSQILGFGDYGFPESHAASFAKLVYVSCWFKCHEPACFLAAMVNSQPMGFYTPSQLVQDAIRHGVEVRAVDVMHSHWDCTLEPQGVLPAGTQPAVRLGLRLVAGLREDAALRLVAARAQAPFSSTEDLVSRAQLGTLEVNALAAADALLPLSGHRRQQVWEASAIKPAPRLLKSVPTHETPLVLPDTPEGENILFDYQATGLTLRRHPVALLRERLARKGLLSASELNALPDGEEAAGCGIVTVRQQPQTAKGTIFVTLEDETGPVNVIVWKSLREAQRAELLHSRLLAVYGVWQRSEESGTAKGYGAVRNLVARRLEDLTPLLGRLGTSSRDFH
ncbi:error-prone DNA polymerase [Polaromonas sp. JS666]|uniref:error-prone DNA polymerase n=1 Tax=Polaromonas sp. (strain JS666 / ATCC BAA-500) TaxID=296591 RepID=UPI0008870C01|nr:error-prone DNA polymerase [Polaromonas sp. JS666]SDM47685.1 error-prone DNA polymerase [Polaromonas sp. JS666]